MDFPLGLQTDLFTLCGGGKDVPGCFNHYTVQKHSDRFAVDSFI